MKRFYVQYNIGKVKYVVNYHNGIDRHKDGSEFFGVKCFRNKKKLAECTVGLLKDGYSEI